MRKEVGGGREEAREGRNIGWGRERENVLFVFEILTILMKDIWQIITEEVGDDPPQ